jgi:SAM-dependent methyltransferase
LVLFFKKELLALHWSPFVVSLTAMRPISRYTRHEKLLGGLDLGTTAGLEIGALNSPLLRPPQANIRFVDHADQAALRAKYANDPNVPIDDIVSVDAVWGNRTLAECFPGEHFDYVIASHVIEHVPDVIGWLAEIAAVLRPGGRLILAIPDRRYTFDVLRRETTLADLIDSHFRGARRPTPGQIFDSMANVAAYSFEDAWAPSPPPWPPSLFATPAYALSQAKNSRDGAYIDCHCSVFTARSVLQLLDGLLELKMFLYRLERFHVAPVGSNEMSLVLLREPDGADAADARPAFRRLLEAGVDSEGLKLDTSPVTTSPDQLLEDASIAQLQQALSEMQASTSWRITAPMRCVIRFLRLEGSSSLLKKRTKKLLLIRFRKRNVSTSPNG